MKGANEYKDNLPDFISDVRAEFGKPNLPFVIATTGMANEGPVDTPLHTTATIQVERAQLWVTRVSPNRRTTLTDDTRGYWETASISPFDQGLPLEPQRPQLLPRRPRARKQDGDLAHPP